MVTSCVTLIPETLKIEAIRTPSPHPLNLTPSRLNPKLLPALNPDPYAVIIPPQAVREAAD